MDVTAGQLDVIINNPESLSENIRRDYKVFGA